MISVIIPLYNVEKYIYWCLMSFENQEYKDFEIIVVNDGSTDNSINIVNNFMKTSNMRIKMVHQENTGVSAARNKGLLIASGTYICFIDSDDMIVPEYLSTMIEAMNQNDCQMVICGTKSITEDVSNNLSDYDAHKIAMYTSYIALKKFLLRDIAPGVGSFIIKKEILDYNNFKFSEKFCYSEDIEMIYKLISKCKNVAYTKDQLYLYRIRNNSAMSIINNRRDDGFKLMQGLERYFGDERSDFSDYFKKYGVARWVFATLWQLVLVSENYSEFMELINLYNARDNMKKLILFPKFEISLVALVYTLSPRFYFNLIGILKYNNKRKFNNSN